MRTFTAAVACVAVSAQALTNDMTDFTYWAATMGRNYSSVEKFNERYAIWAENKSIIDSQNSDSTKQFTLGYNKLMDWSAEEYQNYLGPKTPFDAFHEAGGIKNETNEKNDRPTYINWVEQGFNNPIQDDMTEADYQSAKPNLNNQYYSDIATIEGRWFAKTGKLVKLSEQQCKDCTIPDPKAPYSLCWIQMGLEAYGFHGGAIAAADYPVTSPLVRGNCQKRGLPVAVPLQFEGIGYNFNIEATMDELANGPISTMIDASSDAFRFYKGGILGWDGCGGVPSTWNHSMTIVGYGTDAETTTDYWLIRNSWGADWGEEGYVRIERSETQDWSGPCGVIYLTNWASV